MADLMSHTWQANINNCIENEITVENVLRLAEGIQSGKIAFLEFIESIGNPLTNKDVNVRRKANNLLSDVVSQLPSDFLSEKEGRNNLSVVVLVEFMCDRLRDHHSITPLCLKGLDTLSKHVHLPRGAVLSITQHILKEVVVQTLVQADRLLVYGIFEHFLKNRLDDLMTLDSEFIVGLVQAIDAEKDPRNLLTVFEIVKIVAQNFPLSVVAEELFEVVACYFPVDFSPPPNYSQTVTREQLSSRLLDCFTATPVFAEFCLPLLMEKLSSNLVGAKIEALNCLVVCCSVYPLKNIADYSGAFWSLIRKEIFRNRQEVESSALEALTAITRALSFTPSTDNEDVPRVELDKFARDVTEDCSKYLEEPSLQIFHQSGKLLTAVMAASYEASTMLLKRTIPILIKEFNLQTQIGHRENILILLSSFVRVNRSIALPQKEAASPLSAFKEDLFSLYTSLLNNPSPQLRSQGVLGLVGLLHIPGLFGDEEIGSTAQHLLELTQMELDPVVRENCVCAMTNLSTVHPNIASQLMIPRLISTLKEDFQNNFSTCQNNQKMSHLLNTLARISIDSRIVQQTVPVFVELLGWLHEKGCDDLVHSIAVDCLNGLNLVVSSNVLSNDCLQFFTSFLLLRCQLLLLQGCSMEGVLSRVTTIAGLSKSVRTIAQRSQPEDISPFASSVVSMFLHGNLEGIGSVSPEVKFGPLQVGPLAAIFKMAASHIREIGSWLNR